MIPKIIHYVWLGGHPLNPLGLRCLSSWKAHLPDWRIKLWDEGNSPINHPFVRKMLADNKYAFASDYIRLHALANEGGLYLDTDMELKADVCPFLERPCVLAFLSAQNRPSKNSAALGFLASVPGHEWILQLLRSYTGQTEAVMNTTLATRSLKKRGLPKLRNKSPDCEFWDLGDIRIYHSDFFYPSLDRCATHRCVAIHHGETSWHGQAASLPWWRRLYDLRLDRKILRPIERALRALWT